MQLFATVRFSNALYEYERDMLTKKRHTLNIHSVKIIERLWSTLRTKLKLATQANFGGIARKEAVDARKETFTKKDEAEVKRPRECELPVPDRAYQR